MPPTLRALGLAALLLGCSNIDPNNPLKLQHERERQQRNDCRPLDTPGMRTGSPNSNFDFVCRRPDNQASPEQPRPEVTQ
ncbi:hypothetical protein [Pseudomonas sp. LRF_L74]|uniref:hypothetical protein n=1 Tax=Pseudomonas sp. LRF_L74 TaxID=3369422 RepID=UPI003F5FF0FA